jgi:hypothetical protein
MPVGPGKYDNECTQIMHRTSADAVVLIVTGGDRGHGFSVTWNLSKGFPDLPTILRKVADEIELSIPKV